jgi:hypothetical protein
MVLGKEMGPGSCQLAEEIDFLGRRHSAFPRISPAISKAEKGLRTTDYKTTDYATTDRGWLRVES